MSDSDLFAAVAQKTGEDCHKIRRRGFVLTGPDDTGPEPECLLDVMLVDLPETGTVDWDAVLGDGGFRCSIISGRPSRPTGSSATPITWSPNGSATPR